MHELDDTALLREYVMRNSGEAFTEIVARHVNKVYSVALRNTGNPDSAEEITQTVFVILARKSPHLGQRVVLSGWLYETARLTAMTFIRSEIRRASREQEAHMQIALNENESETWTQIAPMLDSAMAGLNETDRHAVVLRFFDGKSMGEVGAALSTNEEAAKKRVNRALEKLRTFFKKRGVSSTTAIIAGAISINSVQAAPVALAKSVTAVAIARGAAASGPTLTLINAALKAMTWAKLKFISGIVAAVLLAGSLVAIAVTNITDNEVRYQIDGDLVYKTPNREFIRNFTLTVNGRNWAIHLTGPDWKKAGIQYEEEVCLNGSVYRYWYGGPPSPGRPVNSGGATIERGDCPVEDDTFGNFVWVGLASASYFTGATNGKVVSLMSMPRTYKADATWQLSDQPPHLPTSIDYYEKPGHSFLGGDGIINNGWKSGEVRVLNERKIGNETFPMVYTYEQFRPKLDGGIVTSNVEHQLLVTVNVHSIRLDSVPDVLTPKTEGTTAVGETRFPNNPDDKPTVYFSTADRLPEKLEAEAIKERQSESHSATLSHLQVKSERLSKCKLICLSAVVIISIAAAIMGMRKRRHAT